VSGSGAVHIGHSVASSVGSGGNWAVADPTDATNWNTEAEINAHIETFPILPNRQFAITMNLKTTDREVTPEVTEIRVLMEVCIDYIEDIVLRSLLPAIDGAIDPIANLAHVPLLLRLLSPLISVSIERTCPITSLVWLASMT
jgi:hypothetical protein